MFKESLFFTGIFFFFFFFPSFARGCIPLLIRIWHAVYDVYVLYEVYYKDGIFLLDP